MIKGKNLQLQLLWDSSLSVSIDEIIQCDDDVKMQEKIKDLEKDYTVKTTYDFLWDKCSADITFYCAKKCLSLFLEKNYTFTNLGFAMSGIHNSHTFWGEGKTQKAETFTHYFIQECKVDLNQDYISQRSVSQHHGKNFPLYTEALIYPFFLSIYIQYNIDISKKITTIYEEQIDIFEFISQLSKQEKFSAYQNYLDQSRILLQNYKDILDTKAQLNTIIPTPRGHIIKHKL